MLFRSPDPRMSPSLKRSSYFLNRSVRKLQQRGSQPRLVAEAPNWSDAPFPEWRVRNDLYSKFFASFEGAVCLNGDLPRRELHLDNVDPRDGGSAAKCLRRHLRERNRRSSQLLRKFAVWELEPTADKPMNLHLPASRASCIALTFSSTLTLLSIR